MKLRHFGCDGDALDAVATPDGVGRGPGSVAGRPDVVIPIPTDLEARFRTDFEVPLVPRAKVGRAHVRSVLPRPEVALK